jgi:hypothetical protein
MEGPAARVAAGATTAQAPHSRTPPQPGAACHTHLGLLAAAEGRTPSNPRLLPRAPMHMCY